MSIEDHFHCDKCGAVQRGATCDACASPDDESDVDAPDTTMEDGSYGDER